jgi:hypothetical protein
MLLYHIIYLEYFCLGMLFVSLLVAVCAFYAYAVNSQRSDDDPQKRSFKFVALLAVPFTWPLFLLAFASLFLIRALAYGFFLILFTISLILIPRKSSEPTLLEKVAASIGERLLEANALLLRLFLRPWADEST